MRLKFYSRQIRDRVANTVQEEILISEWNNIDTAYMREAIFLQYFFLRNTYHYKIKFIHKKKIKREHVKHSRFQ